MITKAVIHTRIPTHILIIHQVMVIALVFQHRTKRVSSLDPRSPKRLMVLSYMIMTMIAEARRFCNAIARYHRDHGMMKFALKAFIVWYGIESVVRVCFSFYIQVGTHISVLRSVLCLLFLSIHVCRQG